MSEGKVTTERKGHVFLIGLDRADKANAFDCALWRAVSEAYGELEDDGDLRVGVLFAHGKHFTGGVELTQWKDYFAAGRFPDLPEKGIDPLNRSDLRPLTKPIVMAVQGICFTIGLELLLATDIRVAAENVRFGQIEIKRGIYPVGGGTVRLIQEVGWGNAQRYLLTGDEINAQEALRIGLVQEVTPVGKELDRAVEIAQTIAAQAPLGVKASLLSSRMARLDGERAAFARLMPDIRPIMKSGDAAEGVASFVERRAAKFEGK